MKQINQQIIKNNNLKIIYNFIQKNPGISRAKLAKLTSLSKTTVSSLTDELIERSFIQDTGVNHDISAIGRKPNGLQLLQGHYSVIVFSWHNNRISGKSVDICGSVTAGEAKLLEEGDTYTSVSRELLDKMLGSCVDRKQILGICIVVPAMLDVNNKRLVSTVLNSNAYGTSDLFDEIQKVFPDYPVAVLNDTACASYAEKSYTQIDQKDFVYINFQHGIGAALFINNQLLGNATASYTQFGHYSINPDGRQCTCGNKGCLELMIGEDSLSERILKTNYTSVLTQIPNITYAALGSAALYGDLAAQRVIKDIAYDFYIALSNLICLVHPKAIIIGGKGKDLGPLFLKELTANLSCNGFRQMLDSVELVRYSMLDSVAYVVGAMKYFFDIHYDFSQDFENTFFIG